MATHEFKTVSGYTLRLRRIPLQVVELALEKVEKELRAQGLQLDPPGFFVTPEFPDGTKGDPQWFPHTAYTLDDTADPQTSARNRARWDAYQQAKERLETERSNRRITIWYQYGITVEGGVPGVPEPKDADKRIADYHSGQDDGTWMDDPQYWQTVNRMLGAVLPTDPLELKARWITERCLTNTELAEITAELFALQMEGSVKPDELDSFRQGLRAQAAGAIRARVAGIIASVERTMDTQPDQ